MHRLPLAFRSVRNDTMPTPTGGGAHQSFDSGRGLGLEPSVQRSLSANPPAGTTANAASHIAKRAFDIAVGSLLCLMAIPVVVVCAAVLVLQHHSLDVFFTHTRVGFGGEPVRMPKLRTLRRDTHPYADKTVVELIPVSTFARVLRRTHLDELPQLFLVPLGRLSLVGPRPRMVDEAAD